VTPQINSNAHWLTDTGTRLTLSVLSNDSQSNVPGIFMDELFSRVVVPLSSLEGVRVADRGLIKSVGSAVTFIGPAPTPFH
jgi:hypothetical protein